MEGGNECEGHLSDLNGVTLPELLRVSPVQEA